MRRQSKGAALAAVAQVECQRLLALNHCVPLDVNGFHPQLNGCVGLHRQRIRGIDDRGVAKERRPDRRA